jgi:hypothetical protein
MLRQNKGPSLRAFGVGLGSKLMRLYGLSRPMSWDQYKCVLLGRIYAAVDISTPRSAFWGRISKHKTWLQDGEQRYQGQQMQVSYNLKRPKSPRAKNFKSCTATQNTKLTEQQDQGRHETTSNTHAPHNPKSYRQTSKGGRQSNPGRSGGPRERQRVPKILRRVLRSQNGCATYASSTKRCRRGRKGCPKRSERFEKGVTKCLAQLLPTMAIKIYPRNLENRAPASGETTTFHFCAHHEHMQ